MANKTIPELNTIDQGDIDESCVLPIDDGAQTFKMNFVQLFDAIMGGGGAGRQVAGSTTIDNDDTMIEYDTTSGAIGQTLPLPAAVRTGKVLILKNIGIAGNDLTLTGSIDNQSSIILAGNSDVNESVKIKNNGTKWQMIP